jgi:hypothetical protein
MAWPRDKVLSREAIHASIAASSGSCQRSPTWVPLPVVRGLPRFFFVVTRIDFVIDMVTTKASRGGSCSFPLGSNPSHRGSGNPITKADSVHSTPPTNTSLSRRALLTKIAALPITAALPAAAPAKPLAAVTPDPDAAFLELGLDYERVLAIEEPLRAESSRIWNAADRLRYGKLGIDPDDDEARGAALNERHNEWKEARNVADKELGYHKAWKKMDRASRKTARVGEPTENRMAASSFLPLRDLPDPRATSKPPRKRPLLATTFLRQASGGASGASTAGNRDRQE